MSKCCVNEKKKCPNGCVGPRGPAGDSAPIVPIHFPILKTLAATFYDTNNDGIIGPGDVFSFTLEGANDPIEREDAGTFLLPFPGLYKVTWQIPINEPSSSQLALGQSVQSTLTTQVVGDGSFDSVPGGIVGKGSPYSQLFGETIVEAVRHNQPIRIENTSNIPVTYFTGVLDSPNQRTISIASMVPERLDSAGFLTNNVPETVTGGAGATGPGAGQVTFSTQTGPGPLGPTGPNGGLTGATGPGAIVNVGVTPIIAPHTGLVIQKAGKYVVEWFIVPEGPLNAIFPYVNGTPIPGAGIRSNGRGTLSTTFVVGDIITLQNITSAPIQLNNTKFPNAYLGIYSYN